jgi:CMP-N-acetylneuraminic acid synthetase
MKKNSAKVMKILCSICARGGSKGIKNKNLKQFCGKPLMFFTINQAKKSKLFNKIVCSSDSKKILKISKKYGVDLTINRPKKISSDKTPKIEAIRHLTINAENFFKTRFDLIVDLDVTAPLRSLKDIKNAIKIMSNKKKKPFNLITLTPSRKNPYFNMVEVKNRRLKIVKQSNRKVTSRQLAPQVFDIDPCIYIWNRLGLLSNRKIINKNTCFYAAPKARSLDIDSNLDFRLVQFLFKR